MKPKGLIQTVPSLFDERSTVIIVSTYKKYSLRSQQFQSYNNVYNTIKKVSFYLKKDATVKLQSAGFY